MTRRSLLRWSLAALLSIALSACAPAIVGPNAASPADGPSAGLPPDEVRSVRVPRDLPTDEPILRTAWEAWLRMELGRLATGAYTTDALLDLLLPTGIRWTVVDYGPDAYALVVTGDGTPTGLRVDPDGVGVAR